MFSGGEAFRIDFALRIAISKLLARRAGTALQTLIIDEGFGSQDEDGLNRLMDAIYSIQNDFSKVIVVSHLPIFKDNFPVHFVVEKMPTGSTVNVVERGWFLFWVWYFQKALSIKQSRRDVICLGFNKLCSDFVSCGFYLFL